LSNKITFILYFLAGLIHFITAGIFLFSHRIAFAVLYICLGVTFCSLGVYYMKKNKAK